MSDYNTKMKAFRDDVALRYATKDMSCPALPFAYPYAHAVDHTRLCKVIKMVKQTVPFTLGRSTGLQMPAHFDLKKELCSKVKEQVKQVDIILNSAVDHPLLPPMTGLDEEVRWAEYLFHSFILELPLAYEDELVRCYTACLRWAAEPIAQVASSTAGSVFNNHIMGSHRAGAIAATGSGDMGEQVEVNNAEVPELVEDDSMEVDEDVGEEEDEEDGEEEEEEEDDDRLWPVSGHPLMMRDRWHNECRNALFDERVLAVALHRFRKAESTVDDNGRSRLWESIWASSREHVNDFDTKFGGRAWSEKVKYYITRRVSLIEYRRRQSPGRSSKEGLEQWASRVYKRVTKDEQDQLMADWQAAEQAAMLERLAAAAREEERREMVKTARARRVAEGSVTKRLKKEAREVRKRARALRKQDDDLAAESRNLLDTTPERRAEIEKERAEIQLYLSNNVRLQAAKKDELEAHIARADLNYERERRDINRLTPRERLLKRGRP